MADNVGYTPGTGATVAADDIGGLLHQRIKLVVGSDGTSLGDVDVTNPMPVSGTVSVSGAVGTTVVSGTVSLYSVVPVTTQASVSVTGLPVWMSPTQGVTILGAQSVNTIAAGFSVNALVTGVVSVSAMPNITGIVQISTSQTIGTIVTVLGTQIVSVVPGLSVSAVVSGTVTVSGYSVTTTAPGITATGMVAWIVGGQSTTVSPVFVSQINPPAAGGGSVTTTAPAITATGQVVWIAGGQSTTVSPVYASVATVNTILTIVTQLGTQVVSIVPGVSVTLPTVATILTIVTILGTQVVSVVPGVSVNVGSQATGIYTTTATSGVTGPIVWLGVGQTLATVNVLNTVVTILGTQVVSVVPGLSVSAQVLGSVSLSGTGLVSMVAGASVSVLNVVNTVVTILSTVNVAIVAGAGGGGSVTTTAPGITATGQVMWIVGGQSTTVSPVFVSQINAPAAGGGSVTTTAPGITASGQVVWVAGGQSTTVSPVFASVPTVQSVLTIVTVLGTQIVSIAQTSVSMAALPTVNTVLTLNTVLTVVTILGTQIVSMVPGVSVNIGSQATGIYTTTATSGVTGPIVWLGVGQTMATILTIVTQLGTQIVSVVPGVSVTLPTVATILTIVTQLGTQIVSVVPGVAVSISQIAASMTIGTIVTVLGTQIVSVVPGLSVLASISVSAALGTVITILGTQIVSVASVLVQPFCMILSSTVIGSNTSMLMTIYTGNTFVATGTSAYAVPAGKVLRIMGMYMINQSSAVLGRGNLVILVGTATASLSVTSTVGIAAILPYVIPSGVSATWQRDGIVADIAAGTSIVPAVIGGTTMSIGGGVISGYLF